MNFKYVIFGLVLTIVSFTSTHSVEAVTYSYNCLDGGTMYSTVDSPSGPFAPSTSFQVQASIYSGCDFTKTVNLTASNNGGAPITLIPSTNINFSGVLPSSGFPVTQFFTTPSSNGSYSVTFTTGVFENFECSDGFDNDGDSGIDYGTGHGYDLDCTSAIDNREAPSGGGGSPLSYYSCFIEDTKVAMADGTVKDIEDVKIGDVLKGETTNNTVLAYHRPPELSGLLYGFNGGRIFFTEEHPFKTTEGWKSINPEKTRLENIGIEVTQLEVGDSLITEEGNIEINSIESESAPSDTPLYNFTLSGDRTYYADEYLVHNKSYCPQGYGCVTTAYDPHILTLETGGTMPVVCSIGHIEKGPYDPYQSIAGCGYGAYKYLGCYSNTGSGVMLCGNTLPQ